MDKNQKNPIEQQSQEQNTAARNQMRHNRDDLMSAYIRNTSEAGRRVETHLRQMHGNQSKEIIREIEEIRKRQVREVSALNAEATLRWQSRALEALTKRYTQVLLLHAGSNSVVDTPAETEALIHKGVPLLLETGVQSIIISSSPEAMKDIAESLPKDAVELANKLKFGGHPTEEDWNIILPRLRALAKEKLDNGKQTVGALLLTYLDPADRMEIIRRFAKDPLMKDFLLDGYRGGYFQKIQFHQVVKELGDNATSEETAILESLLKGLNNPQLDREREVIAERLKPVARYFGDQNFAKGLLTVEGVAGVALGINGLLTVILNIMANLKTPLNTFNRGFFAGVGMMSASAQISKGYGGMIEKPTDTISRLTRNKKAERQQRENEAVQTMADSLTNHPELAKLYYLNADTIAKTYQEKYKAGQAAGGFTLQEVGLTPEILKTSFPALTPEEAQKGLNLWARKFRNLGEGITRTTGESQKAFMDQAFEHQTGKPLHEIISQK